MKNPFSHRRPAGKKEHALELAGFQQKSFFPQIANVQTGRPAKDENSDILTLAKQKAGNAVLNL